MKWKYPASKISPVVDILHDYRVVDNYQWLEDSNNPKTKEWVTKQNEFSLATIKQNGHFDVFQNELVEYFNDTVLTSPSRTKNGMYVWEEQKNGQNQSVIYMKNSLDGEPIVLIDPNAMGADGIISLSFWQVSTEGRYIAYGITCGGSEITTMRIKEISSGKDLGDEIQNVSSSSVCWLSDESGFYYIRGPKPGTVAKNDERYYVKIYEHKLGDKPDNDRLIFGNDRPKDDWLGISLTMDDRYLCIRISNDWNRNDLCMYDTKTNKTKIIVEGVDAKFILFSTNDRYFLKTNYHAENGRVLTAPLGPVPESIDDWQELIPETEHTLAGIDLTADKLLANYMIDASNEVMIFDHDGNSQGRLPLPPFSSVTSLNCCRWSKEFFFGVTNFISPLTIYGYDPKMDKYYTYHQQDKTFIKFDDYAVKQEWVISRDGTKVPMFIVNRKDTKLNGSNPTILRGYGCHGISETPGFKLFLLPWLKRGGVYAYANIRGGGEYGEKWHRDGSMEKKQNTFDDFIAAAEYLVNTKVTNPKQLGIMGGSNGGLMVGAVMAQRPELFNAVVCTVPVLDLYRYHKFLIAGRWVHEFGNPEKPAEFEWLRQWSPYHHVKSGVEYPNILLTTAINDTRVAPLHAWKMAALLQATNKDNVVLLRTEMEAGHGPGKPTKKRVEGQAYTLAFLAWKLKLSL